MTTYPLLTATTFTPLTGAAVILVLGSERLAPWIALATALATLTVSAVYWHFDKTSSVLQFFESAVWIPSPTSLTAWALMASVCYSSFSAPF